MEVGSFLDEGFAKFGVFLQFFFEVFVFYGISVMLLSIPEICCEIHVIIYSFMCKSFRFGLLRPYHSKNEKYAKREIFWSNLPVVDFLCLPACQLSNLVVARLQLSLCSVSVYSSWFGVRTRGE
jgi:hypothetical protein